ncbi:MAG: type II toxin-antitoxin system PemK/MazF family toxin [Acidobacteriota bacterium]|nr:type II toxin-antitoxin system PemK/MazF family toxin [Acidobacteriota bacterium]
MVSSAAGAVVLVRFPFSDLSQTKLRPAVVLADAERGDWILCQVTSRPYGDARAVPLAQSDFSWGGLRVPSHARPGKLFTANTEIIAADSGMLTPEGDAHRRCRCPSSARLERIKTATMTRDGDRPPTARVRRHFHRGRRPRSGPRD